MKKVVLFLTIAAAVIACNNNTDGDKTLVTLPPDAPRQCTQAKLDSFIALNCRCGGGLICDTQTIHHFIYDQHCDCGR